MVDMPENRIEPIQRVINLIDCTHANPALQAGCDKFNF